MIKERGGNKGQLNPVFERKKEKKFRQRFLAEPALRGMSRKEGGCSAPIAEKGKEGHNAEGKCASLSSMV